MEENNNLVNDETRYVYTQQRIWQEVFIPSQKALAVFLKNLEIELNLSHATGDSIFAIRPSLAVKANEEVNCAGYAKFCAFEPGVLMISPSDEGNDFFQVNYTPGQVLEICGRRLRCSVNCVLQG